MAGRLGIEKIGRDFHKPVEGERDREREIQICHEEEGGKRSLESSEEAWKALSSSTIGTLVGR